MTRYKTHKSVGNIIIEKTNVWIKISELYKHVKNEIINDIDIYSKINVSSTV